jgi:outer membrane immunogenic protein
MKRFAIVAAMIAATPGAHAAEKAAATNTKPPAYAAPAYDWTGFYIGGHAGGAFAIGDGFTTSTMVVTGSRDAPGFTGGGQFGADYQFAQNWVVGLEGQVAALSGIHHNFTDGGDSFRDSNGWLASVTGRLGYAWGPYLAYAKAGGAFRDDGFDLTDSGYPPPMTITATDHAGAGYTIGGGLEYMLSPAWSAKVEYQYYDFGTTHVTSNLAINSTVGYRDAMQTVKLGLSYRFK